MNIYVDRLYPRLVKATSKWDGEGPVELLVYQPSHEYPYLVRHLGHGNKAWVNSIKFEE